MKLNRSVGVEPSEIRSKSITIRQFRKYPKVENVRDLAINMKKQKK